MAFSSLGWPIIFVVRSTFLPQPLSYSHQRLCAYFILTTIEPHKIFIKIPDNRYKSTSSHLLLHMFISVMHAATDTHTHEPPTFVRAHAKTSMSIALVQNRLANGLLLSICGWLAKQLIWFCAIEYKQRPVMR